MKTDLIHMDTGFPDRPDHLYRVDGWLDEHEYAPWPPTVRLWAQEFPIIKRTPRGCWITLGTGKKKFVLGSAKKRYAYPTKREAMEALVYRKSRHIAILRFQLKQARAVKSEVEKLLGCGSGTDSEECGGGTETDGKHLSLLALDSDR